MPSSPEITLNAVPDIISCLLRLLVFVVVVLAAVLGLQGLQLLLQLLFHVVLVHFHFHGLLCVGICSFIVVLLSLFDFFNSLFRV